MPLMHHDDIRTVPDRVFGCAFLTGMLLALMQHSFKALKHCLPLLGNARVISECVTQVYPKRMAVHISQHPTHVK